jgi:hypothetical protein
LKQNNNIAKEFKMNFTKMILGIVLSAIFSMMSFAAFAEEAVQANDVARSIDYVSGGIGESELEMMQGKAKDFPLELVFVQKSKQKEEYLADIKVKIQDAHKNIVLETVAEGPYLFVNLPQGRYTITAVYNKDEKIKYARVYSKKHQKVVFWWPILGPPEFNVEQEE